MVSWYQASVDGKQVYLIDTPGFDDSRVSDMYILKHISRELKTYYEQGKLLNGILYLYDISQARARGSGLKVRMPP